MIDLLEQLNRVRGVGGSLLLSADGLAIASSLRNDTDEDTLSAALGNLIERSLALCDRLHLQQAIFVQLQGDAGGLLLLRSGPGFLAMVTDPHANLALLQLEAKPYVDALAQRMAL
jgi:predicted regulator of Ras-like GTPase activity (Roadblock/LC7/MglB family)